MRQPRAQERYSTRYSCTRACIVCAAIRLAATSWTERGVRARQMRAVLREYAIALLDIAGALLPARFAIEECEAGELPGFRIVKAIPRPAVEEIGRISE